MILLFGTITKLADAEKLGYHFFQGEETKVDPRESPLLDLLPRF
jgi:hypothetical protein